MTKIFNIEFSFHTYESWISDKQAALLREMTKILALDRAIVERPLSLAMMKILRSAVNQEVEDLLSHVK